MPDNRRISIPNSSLTDTPIINYSREGTRRLDVTYAVSYKSDMEQVFSVLKNLVDANPSVLKDPAPMVHIIAYNDSSISFVVRLWCNNAD